MYWGWGYDIDKISQLIYCHRDCEATLAPLHLFPQLNISHLLTHVKWIDQFGDSTHVEKVPPLKKIGKYVILILNNLILIILKEENLSYQRRPSNLVSLERHTASEPPTA